MLLHWGGKVAIISALHLDRGSAHAARCADPGKPGATKFVWPPLRIAKSELILPRSGRRRGLRRSFGPIGLREFDSPEMRRRRYKLQADPLAFSIIVAEVNDAAFLFLLREGIGDG